MGRTDMGGYDAMIFKFAEDTSGTFYMKDTPMPLSIAWFDGEGRFVSSTDMEPCLNQRTCPTYAAEAPTGTPSRCPRGSSAPSASAPAPASSSATPPPAELRRPASGRSAPGSGHLMQR